MGLRFRKSVKIAPGVRVNVGNKSAGVSVGGRGARVSVNTSGRRTTSVGIPGTGLSYISSSSSGKKKNTPAEVDSPAPRASRAGGTALLVVAVLALVIGLPTLQFGGWVFLIIAAPCLLLGLKMIKRS